MFDSSYAWLVREYIWMAPLVIVSGLGLMLGLSRWKRFPLVAPTVLIVSAVSLVHVLVWPFIFEATSRIVDFEERANALAMMSLTDSIIHAVVLAALFWAVFAGRKSAEED